MNRSTETGRISFFAYLFFFFPRFARHISVAVLAAFLQLPAFFSSCSRIEEPACVPTKAQIYIQWATNPTPEALDLFFFHTREPMELDAYQQVSGLDSRTGVYALSGSGDRQMAALSAEPGNLGAWTDILTYGSLEKVLFSLDEEEPQRPKLFGESFLEDARSRIIFLKLQTMLCSIRIRSVCADFSGHPYAGALFQNDKLYLINAGVECRPFSKDAQGPVSWMNQGCLDSTAVTRLPHPEMLLQEGYGMVGKNRILQEKTFYCYANPAAEEGLGTPITRIVLEGSIDGITCYYPISLPAMAPGACYQLDLTLTRMGSPDPDIPVESGTVIVHTQILPWTGHDPETLEF